MMARTQRRGFTLVEMLVVIAILGVLATLTLSAVMVTRVRQQTKISEDTVRKLESAFVQQSMAVIDSARKTSIPDAVMRLAESDPDRAKTLWAYLKYRRAFPETIAEAKTTLSVWDPATSQWVQLPELSPPNIFNSLPAVTNGNLDVQAGVLAYLFMTQRAERGMVSAMDEGMGSQFVEVDLGGGAKGRMFKDAFNNPITFRRFARSAELDAPPFVKAGETNLDPFDPKSRLRKFTSATVQNFAFETVFGPSPVRANPAAQPNPPQAFPNENVTGTFWSSGQNGKFGDADDIFGYRVRQGN